LPISSRSRVLGHPWVNALGEQIAESVAMRTPGPSPQIAGSIIGPMLEVIPPGAARRNI
jgi:hypothetical protein